MENLRAAIRAAHAKIPNARTTVIKENIPYKDELVYRFYEIGDLRREDVSGNAKAELAMCDLLLEKARLLAS